MSQNIVEFVACTRIRLSSHRLRVETGRWDRIPFENRTCLCGAVQTEEHVLLNELHIHESILFGFPGKSDDVIVINYCILYAKHYIYLEKLKENKNQNKLNIDFLGYLSKLKYILKIEKSLCIHNNQSIKFNKFNFIYDNL